MRLTSWDLLGSFLVGVAAASVAWGIWALGRRGVRTPEASPLTPAPAAAPQVEPAPSPPVRARSAAVSPRELRTSQRVILHLSRQPRLAYGDVAPRSITQAGMTEALGVPQPALTKVLGRLVDGGALLATRTHVSGAARRLKVYQLTAHGEAIARDLRRRERPTAPFAAAPDPIELRGERSGTPRLRAAPAAELGAPPAPARSPRRRRKDKKRHPVGRADGSPEVRHLLDRRARPRAR